MGESILVESRRPFARIAVRWGIATAVVWVSACGGESKDRPRETNNESDASADAGLSRQQATPSDASVADARVGTTVDTTTLPDGASDNGSSSDQLTVTSAAPSSTAVVVTTSSATNTGSIDTSISVTTDSSESGLRPGWVAIDPISDDLTDCSAKLEKSSQFCTYSAACGIYALGSRCVLEGDTWHCTCQPASSVREYLLTGVEDTTACEAGVALCAPRGPSLPTPVCETKLDDISDDSCSAAEHCASTIELGGGVTATVVEQWGSNTCSRSSSEGTMTCTCASGQTAPVHDASLEEACNAMVPLCKAEFPIPDETTELTCGNNTFSQSEGVCELERTCGVRADVGSGYAVLGSVSQRVSCDGSEGCRCSTHVELLAQASGDIEERCQVMDEFCYRDVTAIAAGTVSLSNVEIGGNQTSCNGSAAGTQWASWDEGKSVELTGRITADCAQEQDNDWSCTCASGLHATASFTINDPGARDACDAALDLCALRAQLTPTTAAQLDALSFEFLPDLAPGDAGSN